ncbi:MAG: hypothetical protein K8T89_16460, partial [Planctomycetes bacterium]|nr:hypothetical protein [Planctomycetota bacterium]
MRSFYFVSVLLAGFAHSGELALAAEQPSNTQLANAFRGLIIPNLPVPLVEKSYDWGHQELVAVGVKWEKKEILLKPEILKKLHNDGIWRKISAT